jgi:hypothetical protein
MNYNYQGGTTQTGKRGAGIDPNNVGLLSIPKQTKVFVERLRGEAENKGDKRFDQ